MGNVCAGKARAGRGRLAPRRGFLWPRWRRRRCGRSRHGAVTATADRRRRQSPRRSRDDPLLLPGRAWRAARCRQDRCRAQGALRLRPVRGRPHLAIRRPPDRHRGRSAGHRPASPSRATSASRTSSFSRKSSPNRAARCRARRCRPTSQRIIEVYHRNGRFDVTVVPKIIERPNNRVDLVFEINEGGKTGVRSSSSSAITPIRTTGSRM